MAKSITCHAERNNGQYRAMHASGDNLRSPHFALWFSRLVRLSCGVPFGVSYKKRIHFILDVGKSNKMGTNLTKAAMIDGMLGVFSHISLFFSLAFYSVHA
jgi:hypothetical protein